MSIRGTWVPLVLLVALACDEKSKSSPTGGSAAGGGEAAEAARPKSIKKDLVGSDPKKLAFETRPLLGITEPELVKAYGTYRLDRMYPNTPPEMIIIPGGNAFPGVLPREKDLWVRLDWDGSKVVSYWVSTDLNLREEVVAALTEVRGKPSLTTDVEGDGMQFGTASPVTIVSNQRNGAFLKILVR